MGDNLRAMATMVALVLALSGALAAWAVFPYRLTQVEVQMEKNFVSNRDAVMFLKESRVADREILIRIDERLKRLEETLKPRIGTNP